MKNLVNGKPVIIGGKEVNIKEDSIVNEAAEMMMSSIYAAKFG